MITETDAVATALDAAARRWPEDADSRAQLAIRLLLEGARALEEEERANHAERLEAVEATAGQFDAAFPAGYLVELRDEWPR